MNSLIFVYPKLSIQLQTDSAERRVVYLRCFGATSAKPVELRGSWPGLRYLFQIYRVAFPLTKERGTSQTMVRGTRQPGLNIPCLELKGFGWGRLFCVSNTRSFGDIETL